MEKQHFIGDFFIWEHFSNYMWFANFIDQKTSTSVQIFLLSIFTLVFLVFYFSIFTQLTFLLNIPVKAVKITMSKSGELVIWQSGIQQTGSGRLAYFFLSLEMIWEGEYLSQGKSQGFQSLLAKYYQIDLNFKINFMQLSKLPLLFVANI